MHMFTLYSILLYYSVYIVLHLLVRLRFLFPDGRQIQREILYRPIACRTALLFHRAGDLVDQSLAIVAHSDLFPTQILLLIVLRLLCQVAAGGEECKAAREAGSEKAKKRIAMRIELVNISLGALLPLQRAVVG